MKRILIALALLLPFSAIAQDRYDVPQTGTKVGLTRTGINSNFTFLFIAGTNAFRTAVEKGSNINFVAKSPTNATQLDYCLTNGSGSAGSPQSPLTNDLDAAGNSIENLDAPEITNTTIFIRLWGTNVLSLQGTTNVALNGVSLKDGPSDGNTPQGPWTNVVSLNGFAGTGGDYVQVTNQIAFRVGTNLLAVQGWPDATNIAWNGSALINPGGGATDWKTRGITNSSEGFLVYQQEVATNTWSAAAWVKLNIAGSAASNLIYDTGTNYGFASGFLDETNHQFYMPQGWIRIEGAMADGRNPVSVQRIDLQLYANGQSLTNNGWSIYPADPDPQWDTPVGKTLAGTIFSDGAVAHSDTYAFNMSYYNRSPTNVYSIYGQAGSSAGYNIYYFLLRISYEGDHR